MRTDTLQFALGFGVVALSFALAGGAAAQLKRFDGRWSVEVVTDRGACDRAYRYALVIDNGVARYGGPEKFDISARVAPNGAVTSAIMIDDSRVDFRGRLEDGFGSGLWAMTGGRRCGGTWNAERRN